MLVNADDGDAEAYMNVLWMMMEKCNRYHEWLSHNHSNVYQAMQDKFMSV